MRVEFPDARLSIAVPDDWKVDLRRDRNEVVLPPEHAHASPAVGWTVLLVSMPGTEGFCSLAMFEDLPMGLEEWVRFRAPDGSGVIVTSVELPIGEAIRMMDDPDIEHDVAIFLNGTTYAFESNGTLYEFGCLRAAPSDDLWMSLAKTVAPLDLEPRPPDEPAATLPPAISSVDAFSGFASVVEVADGLLMRADCELALWAAYEDGTFREWLSCSLSPEPVADPTEQGTWPDELVSTSGGACAWVSDYWAVTDGSEVWAEAYELSVTPEGRVFGSSSYGPELLDCSDG